MKSRIKLQKVT